VICFFPFFLIGYKLPVDKVNEFIVNRKREDYLKGILLLVFSLGSAYICSFYYYPDMNIYLMSPYISPEFILRRIVIFAVASLVIAGLAFLIPQKPIPALCKWGRNSLAIYVLHRIITLVFVRIFPAEDFTGIYILYTSIACAATLFVLGQDVVSRTINDVLNKILDYLCDSTGKINAQKKNIFRYILILIMVVVLSLPLIKTTFEVPDQGTPETEQVIYPVLSDIQAADIQDAVSIAFVGDLILLQDQVRSAYSDQTGEYDFSPEFTYASRYLSEADQKEREEANHSRKSENIGYFTPKTNEQCSNNTYRNNSPDLSERFDRQPPHNQSEKIPERVIRLNQCQQRSVYSNCIDHHSRIED